MPDPRLTELRLRADPGAWRSAGFTVDAGACQVGGVRLRFEPGPEGSQGIAGWSLSGLGNVTQLDGLPTVSAAGTKPSPAGGAEHANGAIAVDHVVVSSPNLARTFGALDRAGFALRRVRDAGPAPAWMDAAGATGMRLEQGFYVLGSALLEVVGPARTPDAGGSAARGTGPAEFWGLTVVTTDFDGCVERLGAAAGRPRDSFQPGRRIVSVRAAAGLGVALAFMTPDPSRPAPG